MAKPHPGETLPVVQVSGSHAELGRAIGHAQGPHIRRVIAATLEALREQEISESLLRRQIEPYVAAAERIVPELMVELREMARAADVPFAVLFRLNCYESRPPAPPAGERAPTPALQAKDPAVLPTANAGPAVEVEQGVQPAPAGGGCTSVASRGAGGVVAGHTEDSSPEAIDGLYVIDALVTEPSSATGASRSRFIGLNYAQTLPGCAAAVNEHGLIVLIDALPDPERHVGASRHLVSRALLDLPAIDAAIAFLRATARGGGWNYLLVQGRRIANVEATATRVVVTEVTGPSTYAHSNHYLDPALAAATGEPRPNSEARLARARQLVRPGMDVEQMKRLLSDREGFPDSICHERTIGAFVADTGARRVEVCWGEPDTATWTAHTY